MLAGSEDSLADHHLISQQKGQSLIAFLRNARAPIRDFIGPGPPTHSRWRPASVYAQLQNEPLPSFYQPKQK